MRLCSWFLFSFLLIGQAYAAPSPDFYLKWMKYPLQSSGQVKFQLIERIVPIEKGKHFSVGEISLIEIPKEKNFSVQSLQKDILTAMGFKSWHTRTVGKAKVFEQVWPEARKFYRLYVLENQDTVRLSVATFRMAYGKSLYLESEVVQRLFLREKKNAYDWAGELFSQLGHWVIPEAHAQSPIDWGDLFGGNGGSPLGGLDADSINKLLSGLDQIKGTLGDTNVQLNVANQNWGNTNVQLGEANANWANSNAQMGEANKNWAETNQQMKEYQDILNGFKDQAAKTSDMVDKNWKDTNKIASDYLTTLKDMSRPEKLALAAGATAAGAVLGATAMNMAISGVKWGITEIGRLISGYYKEKKHQERLAEFKQAREMYYKSKTAIDSLESSVDGFIQVFEKANLSKMPMDTILSQLARLKLLKESELKIKHEKLDELTRKRLDGTSDDKCEMQLNALADDMPKLQSLVDAIDSMSKQLKTSENAGKACQDIRLAIGKLIEAEMDLELSRREMVNALSSYIEDMRRKQVQVAELDDKMNSGKDDKRLDKTMGKTKKTVNSQAKDQISDARDHFVDQCQSFLKNRPDARNGRSNRARFCKDFYAQVGQSMSTKLTGRTSDQKMTSTDQAYMTDLQAVMQTELEKFYPGLPDLQTAIQTGLASSMAISTQQAFNAAQAKVQIADVKADTRLDRKSSVDDQYRSNLALFTESVDSAYQMKKEFEKELTGLETMRNPATGKLTAEISELKNTRLDRLQGKKQKIEELCR
jgi:hypothetical protein